MSLALLPPQYAFDEARLAALASHGILDTPAEAGYDDIASLSAYICETPVALVSFVAGNRQWFKARIGFEPCETDLNSSVCAHALVEPDLLVISDLTVDPRSRDNPLVTDDPHIRFYAGAPLRTHDGHVLGSLCVIDTQPRPEGLTDRQAEMLRALARQVIAQLELRRTLLQRDEAQAQRRAEEILRRASESQFRQLFDAIDDGFCIVEVKFDGGKPVDYRFVAVNPAFEGQTGLTDAQGQWMRTLAPNHEQHWFDLYGQVALTGEPIRFEQAAKELDDRWYDVHAFRVGQPAARQVGILFTDASKRRASEIARLKAEALRETLNHELSHRMKNMFAMVQAIALQTLRAGPNREALDAFVQRVHALSTAHDVLLQESWTAAELGTIVRAGLNALAPVHRFDIVGPKVDLAPQATLSVSLLLHELTANALKYGSLSNEVGRVAISWELRDVDGEQELVLDWRENGGPPVKEATRLGFGSKLIRMGLTGGGGADVRYQPSGLTAEFKAPLSEVRPSLDGGAR